MLIFLKVFFSRPYNYDILTVMNLTSQNFNGQQNYASQKRYDIDGNYGSKPNYDSQHSPKIQSTYNLEPPPPLYNQRLDHSPPSSLNPPSFIQRAEYGPTAGIQPPSYNQREEYSPPASLPPPSFTQRAEYNPPASHSFDQNPFVYSNSRDGSDFTTIDKLFFPEEPYPEYDTEPVLEKPIQRFKPVRPVIQTESVNLYRERWAIYLEHMYFI